MKLSQRLEVIASYVEPGSIVADIGTDHGYLPIYLIEQGICPAAIASDIRIAPFNSALRNIESSRRCDEISVRLGDGLEVVRPGEIDTVVIAGMGGRTMLDILARASEVLAATKRMVLQPMSDTAKVRRWLWSNGWRLLDEELVKEDGRLYEIIAAVPGEETAADADIGPRLLEKRHPLLQELLQDREEQLAKILHGTRQSQSAEAKEKEKEVQAEFRRIKKVRKWLDAETL